MLMGLVGLLAKIGAHTADKGDSGKEGRGQCKVRQVQGKAKQGKTGASQQLLTQVIVCSIVYLLIANKKSTLYVKKIREVCK